MGLNIKSNMNIIPDSRAAVLSSPSGWCSAVLHSSLSTCLQEPGRGPFFFSGPNELNLVSPSSGQRSGYAASLHDAVLLLSCAAPSVSPTALQPINKSTPMSLVGY